ncbi:glycosyltransferase family 2 protein [Aeromonas veronii]
MPKVSVIVPVYNTELYVERAIVSLMEQALDDVQFIIIDDGSKDNSLNIIKTVIARYPARQKQVILITRENRGVAATRAQGMKLATGDYVIHLDSDDWAETTWLALMYDKAISENADVVVCEHYRFLSDKIIHYKQMIKKNNIDNIRSLFRGNVSNANWDKLVRRNLFYEKNIIFYDGYDMGEDFLVTFLVLFFADNAVSINKPLYYYNKENESALTKDYTKKALYDLVEITNVVERILIENNILKAVENDFISFKLNTMSLFIVHLPFKIETIEEVFDIYPDIHKNIFSSKMKLLIVLYLLKRMGLLCFASFFVNARNWCKP